MESNSLSLEDKLTFLQWMRVDDPDKTPVKLYRIPGIRTNPILNVSI